MRPRTPIDRMIDAACGIDPDRGYVILTCPDCDRVKKVVRDETDHPKAAYVSYPCPGCRGESEPEVEYFDAAMNPLHHWIDDQP